MTITRITRIRGHRMFRDFAWPTELHSFGKFNLIYGWNGCGKTTLSALLALVEKRSPLSEGELELEFDGTTRVTGAELGTEPVPQVRVFNRDFVNATLQSSADMAPIYFLGEESVEKQAQVDRLKVALSLANTDLTIAASRKRTADASLDEFCIAKAKFIKELLTNANSTSYNNYDKRRFKEAVEQLTSEAAAAALLSGGDKVRWRSQKDAQPKTDVAKVEAPSLDLVNLRTKVDDLVGRSVVAQTLDELTRDTELAAWVQRGLALHSGDYTSETCRFCLKPLDTTRRAALEAHFNDAFASFQRELEAVLTELAAAKKEVGSLPLPDPSRFYDHLAPRAITAIASLKTAAAAVETTLGALIARVEGKRFHPFTTDSQAASALKPPSTLTAATKPEQPDSALTAAVTALNTIVDNHNRTTSDFKSAVSEACKKLEASYVAEAHAEYLQLAEAVAGAAVSLDEMKSQPTTLQGNIDELERQILEHRRPAEELTEELRAYLGRDELRFEVRDNGYALTRGGQPVSHLSEGERTAIALLYFLKSLQDKTFDFENGIVVIDDPVSSLDANALFSAFGYMKERTKQCGQLFILTHSFSFFRLVKNWFHYVNRHRKKLNLDPQPARFFLLRSCRHSADASHTAQLGPLDRLLEEHESEYQYLFKRVYDEAHRADVDSLEHHYGLPNVARRLLEAFLAFRFPDLSGDLSPRLDRVSFDNAKKTRILRLLNTYSHAGAISDPEHDLSLLAETQPVLLELLEMMKALDKDHYDGLERLLAPGDGSP